MNILPHKSWHVRTWKNIERVRKDEANAAEEEKKRLKKVALAEQESRTSILRARTQQKHLKSGHGDKLPVGEASTHDDSTALAVVSPEDDIRKHVNFFRDAEEGKSTGGVNKEHEAEKKAEQEKYEKSIGLLTYLGQSAVESQTSKPWYLNTEKNSGEEKEDDQTNDLKRKHRLDPMHEMNKYLGVKRQKEDPGRKYQRSSTSRTPSKPQAAQKTNNSKLDYVAPVKTKHHKEKHKKSKHKKDHKHRKHGHKDKSSDKDRHKDHRISETSTGPSIEQLRAERLRREITEKARTERFLSGKKEPSVEPKNVVSDEPDRRYNSMFHPELARKHKRKEFPY